MTTDERVEQTLVDMLYDRNLMPAVAGIPFAVLVVGFCWGMFDPALLIGWGTVRVGVSFARIALTRVYRGQPSRMTRAAWTRVHELVLVGDALTWSVMGLAPSPITHPLAAMGLLAALAGIAGVGGVVLSAHRRACTGYLTALLGPVAIWYPVTVGSFGMWVLAALVIYLALLIDHAVRTARSTEELIRLRFELARAHELAVAGTRAKSEFLATMSHELRTPLNAVIGMSTLLADADLAPAEREKVLAIRTSGEILLGLIGDVLDLSRAESGKIEIESIPVDLDVCIEDCIEQVAAVALRKHVALSYDITPDCPTRVRTDPMRLRQILSNLLSNAAKFTSEGSISVRVDAQRAGGACRIELVVADTGPGIASQVLPHVFDDFAQADASTTREFGGTGLGLAITRRLCVLLGGTISVESRLGVGTTFRAVVSALDEPAVSASVDARFGVVCDAPATSERIVRLLARRGVTAVWLARPTDPTDAIGAFVVHAPVPSWWSATRAASPRNVPCFAYADADGDDDARIDVLPAPFRATRLIAALRRGTERADVVARALGPPLTVLVVDDHAINRQVASEMVAKLGHRVLTASHGSEALDTIAETGVDAVMMDVEMPGMDGYDVTREIVRRHGPEGPYVIGLTAHALAEVRARCLESGMRDYLTKPLRLDSLANALAKVAVPRDRTAEHVFDEAVLAELASLSDGSHEALLVALSREFGDELPLRESSLRRGVLAGDAPAAEALAHAMAGVAATMGATRVASAARAVEQALRAGGAAAPELMTRLERAVADTRRALPSAVERAMSTRPARSP